MQTDIVQAFVDDEGPSPPPSPRLGAAPKPPRDDAWCTPETPASHCPKMLGVLPDVQDSAEDEMGKGLLSPVPLKTERTNYASSSSSPTRSSTFFNATEQPRTTKEAALDADTGHERGISCESAEENNKFVEQHKRNAKRAIEGIIQEHRQDVQRIPSLSSQMRLGSYRASAAKIVNHRFFTVVVGFLVLLNSVYIGVETEMTRCKTRSDKWDIWYVIEVMFALTFTVELCLRLFVESSKFFKDRWNVFDTVIVLSSVAETLILPFLLPSGSSMGELLVILRFLRLGRLARILRLLRFFKELWFLMEGIVAATRILMWAWLLMLFIIFIPAIVVTRVLGKANPNDAFMTFYFGTLGTSMKTLFQVMSLEGWADIARGVATKQHSAWVFFFMIFIFCTAFAVMHVVVAVIVQNTLQHASNRQSELDTEKERLEQVALVKIVEVFTSSDIDGDGEVTKQEFLAALEKRDVMQLLHEVNVDVMQAESLFDILDYDESGGLDVFEFVEGVLAARGDAKAADLLAVQCDLWKAERRLATTIKSTKTECLHSINNFCDLIQEFKAEVQDAKRAIDPEAVFEPRVQTSTSMEALEEFPHSVEEIECSSDVVSRAQSEDSC